MSFNLKTTLLAHQEECVDFAISKKYSGNFGKMGTGKSLSALATICKLKKKALVVCPPYLVNNWLNEISKHSSLTGSPHFITPNESDDVTVIPYTQLAKSEALFARAEIVIADEAHYLKNLDAKRTSLFHSYIMKYSPEYFLYLTGTPIKNRIPEIYSMLLLFSMGPNDPKIINRYPSMYTFCCRFTNVKQTNFGMKYEGMKNVEELRQYVNPFTIAHPASVLNLPELRESSVVVSYADNKELDQAFQRFQDKGIGAEITVKRDSAVATAPFTAQLAIEAVESGEGPVIVFSDHLKPLEIMALELSKLRVAIIDGSVAASKRQDIVDQLNRNQLDVLLCTFGAASSGFNMIGSNIIMVNDPPWGPGELEQMKFRIQRLGQLRQCRIVNVVGSKTSEKIFNTLNGKIKVINKVMERA